MNEAVRVTGMEDFDRRFGGLHRDSEASYAISQYYLNGGQIAWVVRVAAGDPVTAQYRFAGAGGSPAGGELVVEAASPGLWAKGHVQVGRRPPDARTGATGLFNLAVRELDAGKQRVVASEVHRNVSMDPTSSRYVKDVVAADSELIRIVERRHRRAARRRRRRTSPVAERARRCRVGSLPRARRLPYVDGTTKPVADGRPPDAAALIARAGRARGDRAGRLQHPLPAGGVAPRGAAPRMDQTGSIEQAAAASSASTSGRS